MVPRTCCRASVFSLTSDRLRGQKLLSLGLPGTTQSQPAASTLLLSCFLPVASIACPLWSTVAWAAKPSLDGQQIGWWLAE